MSLEVPYARLTEAENRRRSGRFRVNDIHASGNRQTADVLDISATGMRVRLKGKLQLAMGEQIGLTVQSAESSVQVQAKVIWISENGHKDHEVGFDFENLDGKNAQAIRTMALDSSRAAYRKV